jgi:hypothetical protein
MAILVSVLPPPPPLPSGNQASRSSGNGSERHGFLNNLSSFGHRSRQYTAPWQTEAQPTAVAYADQIIRPSSKRAASTGRGVNRGTAPVSMLISAMAMATAKREAPWLRGCGPQAVLIFIVLIICHWSDSRRFPNGHLVQVADNVPVPPIPAHVANMRSPVSRSRVENQATYDIKAQDVDIH